jgi:hypothetical protein
LIAPTPRYDEAAAKLAWQTTLVQQVPEIGGLKFFEPRDDLDVRRAAERIDGRDLSSAR